MTIKQRVIFVAAECSPLVKVGGLADVVGSLPLALRKNGIEVEIILPYYKQIKKIKTAKLWRKNISLNTKIKPNKFSVYQTSLPNSNIKIYLIKHPQISSASQVYFDKPNLNQQRFAVFSLAAATLINKLKTKPSVVHLHDWHSALIPTLFELEQISIPTILTIHNLSSQGIWLIKKVRKIIPNFTVSNHRGSINFLAEGIKKANIITTVSPSYAKEILTPKYGFGLDKILKRRKNDLYGIINGIDYQYFNPATDNKIFNNYSINNLNKKQTNTLLLKKELGLQESSAPLLGVVSRLFPQKGLDLLAETLPQIIKYDWQFVLLGTGQKSLENKFKKLAKSYPQKIKAIIDFDPVLAQKIYAGSDIFIIPSRFEPCGLTQMIAMRYGAVPLARATGGLKDTIVPHPAKNSTGFLFCKPSSTALRLAIVKSLKVFNNKTNWRNLQKRAMQQDFSWNKPAQSYIKLYKQLIK